MRYLRAALALLLSAALMLPLAGCHKEPEAAAPDTVASAYFDLAVCDDAAPMQAALGEEVSESGVRAAFLPPDYYDSMASELAAQFSGMGITVSDADAQLLTDATLSILRKLDFSAQVKEWDKKAGTAVVTVSVSTFPANSLATAATAAVADMDLAEFLSDDLDAVFSKIIHVIADTISTLEPTGETQNLDIPFALQSLEIDGQNLEIWLPTDADAFLADLTGLALGST